MTATLPPVSRAWLCCSLVLLLVGVSACKGGHADRAKERLAKATAKAKAEAAQKPPPAPPPPPTTPLKVTVQSGAAAVGEELPPFIATEALSDDQELRERIAALGYKPPNRHTTKMLQEKGAPAVQAVLAGMWHGQARVRAQSARLLTKLDFKKETATEAFNRVLRMDPAGATRAAAASALVDLQIDGCSTALIDVLRKDKDESARANAAWALGKIGHKPAADALEGALVDDATWVRIRSATALGRLRSKGSVKALQHALSDPNGEVRKSASRALKKLTGRNHPPRAPRLSVK